jgi:hypothetical protein
LSSNAERRAAVVDEALERALLANFSIHGLALLGMAIFLLPTLPGGGTADDPTFVDLLAYCVPPRSRARRSRYEGAPRARKSSSAFRSAAVSRSPARSSPEPRKR